MKRGILAFRWFIASLLVGLVAVGVLIVSGVYVPAHTEVTSVAISRKNLVTGLTIWIFLIGGPLITLLLGVRELMMSKSCGHEPVAK